MAGKTYMDNVDIFLAYGLYVTYGGYNSLVQYPALKPVKTNDWPEEDGLECDLSNPVLDTKVVTITFGAVDSQNLHAFFAQLEGSAYHYFEFKEVRPGFNYPLRLVSQQALKLTYDGQYFTTSFQFSDDFPLPQYAYQVPISSQGDTGWQISGHDLAWYGILPIGNSLEEVKRAPAIKPRLIRKFDGQPGILDGHASNTFTSDPGPNTYQAKEVTLDLFMRADSLSGFWRNYHAFLYDLKRPGERMLNIYGVTPQPIPFHYKRSGGCRFLPTQTGGAWCEFSITVLFTSFNPKNS